MIRAVGPSTLIRSFCAALVVTMALVLFFSCTNDAASSLVTFAASSAVTALLRTEMIWLVPTRLTLILDLSAASDVCLLDVSERSGCGAYSFRIVARPVRFPRSQRRPRIRTMARGNLGSRHWLS